MTMRAARRAEAATSPPADALPFAFPSVADMSALSWTPRSGSVESDAGFPTDVSRIRSGASA
jgi:hypothetical protein